MPAEQAPETTLFAYWCEALNLGQGEVDHDADFFALGGTSYRAVEFIDRAERELDVVIPVDTLFLEGTFTAVLDGLTPAAADRSGPR
jgi:acyl carrier protein